MSPGAGTCSVLVPDLDGVVVGGCRHLRSVSWTRGEKHAAGRRLDMTSVLHHLTAGLPQVPQLAQKKQNCIRDTLEERYIRTEI